MSSQDTQTTAINARRKQYFESVNKLQNKLMADIEKMKQKKQNITIENKIIEKLKTQFLHQVTELRNTHLKTIIYERLNIAPPSKIKPPLNLSKPPLNLSKPNIKKALLIGTNYKGTSNELYGCVNDVNSIRERLIKSKFTEINIISDLTNIKPTRNAIIEGIKSLLINAKDGEFLFISYSGHGSNRIDKNKDEKDGRDELIIPCDFIPISDDELKNIINVYLKKNVTLFALFDSCFSGTMLDLKYQYLDSLNYDNSTENNMNSETVGNVIMISGCTDNQYSADAYIKNKPQGAMTWSFLETLNENNTLTWKQLVKTMRDKLLISHFDQLPQISCGKKTNIDMPIFI